MLSYSLYKLFEKLKAAILLESENKFIYIPLFLTIGIGIYFNTNIYIKYYTLIFIIICVILSIIILHKLNFLIINSLLKHNLKIFLISLKFFLIVILFIIIGYTCSYIRSYTIYAPKLLIKTESVKIFGDIEQIDIREDGNRIYLVNIKIYGVNLNNFDPPYTPRRIRLNARTFKDSESLFKVRDRIKINAVLMPPPQPAIPNGFDFARFAYFRSIGAIGYALNKPIIVNNLSNNQVINNKNLSNQNLDSQSPNQENLNNQDLGNENRIIKLIHYINNYLMTCINAIQIDKIKITINIFINNVRQKIAIRINSIMSGAEKAVTNGILIGDASSISKSDFESLRIAGTAHLIAISGMHIVVASGIIFFCVNFILGFFHNLSLRYSIKKISALISIVGIFIYLLLTGAPVSAQRAFIASVLVLLAIVIDRYSDAMKSLAIGGVIILVFTPETIFSPSLQMSFAACAALISGFEGSYKKLSEYFKSKYKKLKFEEQKKYMKIILIYNKSLTYIFGIVYASIIAGLATAPFIIYHFNQFSSYGVLANLLCVPITDFFIMPIGMIALLLMPIGLDYPLFVLMEYGVSLMMNISRYISTLPNAMWHIPNFSNTGIMAVSLGLFFICILKTRLRYISILLISYGFYTICVNTIPDIIISGEGKIFAVNINAIKDKDKDKDTNIDTLYNDVMHENIKNTNIKNINIDDKKVELVFSSFLNERYVRSTWEQIYKNNFVLDYNLSTKNSMSKKLKTKYPQNLENCNTQLCLLEKYGKKIIILNSTISNDDWCPKYKFDLFINMNSNEICINANKNITSRDLREGGTHAIYIKSHNVVIDNVKNYITNYDLKFKK